MKKNVLRITEGRLLILCFGAAIGRPLQGEITAEQVRRSIELGANYLKSQQDAETGKWPEYTGYPGGITSLCTLALINAGVGTSAPAVQKALAYLRSLGNLRKTYATALQTMAFCSAEPRQPVCWLGLRALAGAVGRVIRIVVERHSGPVERRNQSAPR